jgi:hypothetical protein
LYILARVYRNNIQLFGITSLYSTAVLLDSVNCNIKLRVIFFALHNHVRFTFLGGRFLSVGTALTTRYDDDNDDDVPVVVARTA